MYMVYFVVDEFTWIYIYKIKFLSEIKNSNNNKLHDFFLI